MPGSGGIVLRVIPAPRGLAAIEGVWTGVRWRPSPQSTFHVHREGQRIKTVPVRAIEERRHRELPKRRDALILIARSDADAVQPGDIVTFLDAVPAEYAIQGEFQEKELPTFGQLVETSVRPCVIDWTPLGHRAVVFYGANEAQLAGIRPDTLAIPRGFVKVMIRPFRDGRAIAREVVLNTTKVSLTRLVGTLNPLRGFAFGTGHEMLLGKARDKKARFRKEVLDAFEPSVGVLPGSVRILLHEGEPLQMPLYDDVQRSEPFQLLAALSQAIKARNDRRVYEELAWHRVFSAHRFLRQLKQLAMQHAAIVTDQGEVFELTPEDVHWLTLLLRQPERVIVVHGELLAADFKRSWCRIFATRAGREVQWTLYFSPSQAELVKRSLLQSVRVEFATRTPDDRTSGTGRLMDLAIAQRLIVKVEGPEE